MENMEMDLLQLCRSCMKELAMYEKQTTDARLRDLFYFCTNIRVVVEDKLSQVFCATCIIKLENAYIFITEAQKVDETLRNMVPQANTSEHQTSIVEPDVFDKLDSMPLLPDDLTEKIIISEELFKDKEILKNIPSDEELTDFEKGQSADGPQLFVQPISFEPTLDLDIQPNENIDVANIVVEDTNKNVEEIKNNVEEVKKNVCPVCVREFTTKRWFKRHMEKEHPAPIHVCDYCPKTFTKLSQLTNHLPTHSEERNFPCATCGKAFKRKRQLLLHVRAHSDNKPYACDKCTMRFKKHCVLRCHMKIHDEKKYLCSVCGSGFAQATNLATHLRSHTGEKPFSCSQCPFTAAAASNLRRHEKIHKFAGAYKCPTCDKGFCDVSSMTRHVRTHSGERPYSCPRCPRMFSDSWKRKVHLMRVHALALADIPRMDKGGRVILAKT